MEQKPKFGSVYRTSIVYCLSVYTFAASSIAQCSNKRGNVCEPLTLWRVRGHHNSLIPLPSNWTLPWMFIVADNNKTYLDFHVFSYFWPNLDFLDRFSQKSPNIKFHGNPRWYMRGRTDGHDEANRRFTRLCEYAQKLHKILDTESVSNLRCKVS